MSFCELDKLVLTDDDLLSAGYRAHPFDKDGNYVGAPTVRAPEQQRAPHYMTRVPNFTGTALTTRGASIVRFIDSFVLTSAFHVPINNSPRMKKSASPRCARSSCSTPSPTKPSTQ